MSSRRNFIKQTGIIGMAGMINPVETFADAAKDKSFLSPKKRKWADGSRLVVSISMQFESGGQPDNAESPFP